MGEAYGQGADVREAAPQPSRPTSLAPSTVNPTAAPPPVRVPANTVVQPGCLAANLTVCHFTSPTAGQQNPYL